MQKKLRENLKLDKLLALIEVPSEMGSSVKRHKLATRPEPEQLKRQYRNISWFRERLQRNKALQDKLYELFDHLPQLALEHLKLSPCFEAHEFFEIKSFLWVYGKLRALLIELEGNKLHSLPDLEKQFKLLDPEGNGLPAFRISPHYNKTLLQLTEKRADYALKLKMENADFLDKAKAKLNIPNLKEEFILSRNQADLTAKLQQSEFFVLSSESLANLKFRLADSPKALNLKAEIKLLNQNIEIAEKNVLLRLSSELLKHFTKLESAYQATTELLWEYSLAVFALRYDCCIPKLSIKHYTIKIRSAVNLPLKLHLQSLNRLYQSLDFDLNRAANLITGPNMGGKSTALITLGQLCHLAALGIPIPAEQAELPVFDEIYYNHDSGENSETLSSFGREVVSFVHMLSRKGKKLILLDEFARGTNPEEGEILCLAVLEYLQQSGQTFVAATHFSAPTRLPGLAHYSIKGISDKALKALEGKNKADLDDRLKQLSEAMDYSLQRITEKQNPAQCALRIAGILGMPQEILDRAGKA